MDEQAIVNLLGAIVAQESRIATALEILISAQVPAPNYKRQLSEYRAFDWGDISAQVVASDSYGVSKVEWNGRIFTRRNSDDKKKGKAVWFSAVVSGTVADGNVKWGRLISFKDSTSEPEPLAEKIAASQPKPAHTPGTSQGHVASTTTADDGRRIPSPTTAVGSAPPAPTMHTPGTSQVHDPAPAPAPARLCSDPQPDELSALDKHFGPRTRQVQPAPDANAARAKFYALSANAISTKRLTSQQVNELVKAANGGGFAAALAALEAKLGTQPAQ